MNCPSSVDPYGVLRNQRSCCWLLNGLYPHNGDLCCLKGQNICCYGAGAREERENNTETAVPIKQNLIDR